MIEAGVIVVKFWLQISQEEQLRRFQEREKIDFKRFKITQEDWRNREKWDDYQTAICDMIDRTSTGNAPWTLVEANDKNFARVKILRTLCQRLEQELIGHKVADLPKPDKDSSKSDAKSGKANSQSAKSETKGDSKDDKTKEATAKGAPKPSMQPNDSPSTAKSAGKLKNKG